MRNTIKFSPEEVLRECRAAKSNYDGHWSNLHRSIGEYFIPQKSAINAIKPPSTEEYSQGIFDNTAINASQVFAAGCYDYMVAGDFFAWDAPRINGKEPTQTAKDWYAECTQIGQELLAASNWDVKVQEHIYDRTTFATGYLQLEKGKNSFYNFKTVDVGSFYPQQNSDNEIDRVCINYKMTPSQVVDRFGIDNVSEDTKVKFNDPNTRYTHKVDVWQKIAPRDAYDRDPKRIDPLNKPYKSCWVEEIAKHALLESGYDDRPFVVSRFASWGNQEFGWSPAMLVLPANRTLQDVMKSLVQIGEILVWPRTIVPESLIDVVAWEAGGVTVYPDTATNKPEEWGRPTGYPEGERLVESLREQIKESFHVRLFQALSDSTRQKTATEVLQIAEEKLVNFRPTFARFNNETLAPLLKRCFVMALREGKFPPAPEDVIETDVNTGEKSIPEPKPVYVSKIANAMKMLDNRELMEFQNQIQGLLALNPALLGDNYDLDKLIREIGDNMGIDPDLKIEEEARDEMRAAAAAQQQAAMQLQMAQVGAETAKTASEIPQQDRQQIGQALGM